ncbi:dephospho-CoA kinase [Mycoplasmoides pneumoniae]|uniref:dephospho-CoA kinase n=1 Tax=Mycoplasmoides pneumoniae TaxID=2104 RepID=UPI0006BA6834|nr:dephospho-CoA kinase [Mycoplasmoides pneumoniae]
MLIAVVGKAGVGKTTVLQYIADYFHFPVFFADRFIHQQYANGQAGYAIVKQQFGAQFVNHEAVDRKQLAQYVFNQPDELKRLSNLTKPLVQEWLNQLKAQFQDKIALVEIAVMLNYWNDYRPFFDEVIQIERDAKIVKQALKARGVDVEQVQKLIADPTYPILTVINNSTVAECALHVTQFLESIAKSDKCHRGHYQTPK